ncbi:MAG: DMT family transporter [Anaerolineaceae bacterium]|nr:DMT family transporter [Anaerolineaceae bacterium]
MDPESHTSTPAPSAGETQTAISRPNNRRNAVLAVLAAALLWSTSYVVTKVGVSDVPPLTFGVLRFTFASLLVAVLALARRQVQPVPPRDLLRLAAGGLLGITAYFALQNLGMQRTSASEATLLVASFPAITMLMEVIFLKRRVPLLRFAGAGIAFLGIFLVIQQTENGGGTQRLQGDLLLLATGVAWALYNFATQNVVQRYTTFTVIFWQTLFGSLFFLPLALLEAGSWQPLSASGLWGALYLGIFCSVAAFLLYGFGLKSLNPGAAVSLLNLVPVFGLLLAVIGLHEAVTGLQLLGGAVVIGGVTLSVQERPPTDTQPAGNRKAGR